MDGTACPVGWREEWEKGGVHRKPFLTACDEEHKAKKGLGGLEVNCGEK